MKLIPVEAVPKRRGRHHLQDLRSCLGVAAKQSGHPIKVSLREGIVYLSKM